MDGDWKIYRDNNINCNVNKVKLCVMNDLWWNKLHYFLSFIELIYNMLRVANTNMFALHLIYDMWDSIIENVKKKIIFKHKGIYIIYGYSISFNVIHQILESR